MNNTYNASDSRIDIPLREPLDTEYRLNRKLAKQIYNKERDQMVKHRKEEMKQKQESELDKWGKEQKKIDKKREDFQKKHKENIMETFKTQ